VGGHASITTFPAEQEEITMPTGDEFSGTDHNEISAGSPLAALAKRIVRFEGFGTNLMRAGLVLVLLWIGGLKFAKYEADSIVPLIANSPLLRYMYRYPTPQYMLHMNKEGELGSQGAGLSVAHMPAKEPQSIGHEPGRSQRCEERDSAPTRLRKR
jgi:hypothetical protein